MLTSLLQRRRRIETEEAFRAFFAGQAAFVSQKSTVEYCRAKAGMNWEKLWREEPFRSALETCRWEAYAAVLQDLGVVAEGLLRPHAGGRLAGLADALARHVAWALAQHPLPAHRPDGWGDAIAAFRRRLAVSQLAAPQPVHQVGQVAGGRIFELLPIHPRLRRDDRDVVVNNVRFGLCRSYEDLIRRVDAAAVVADMLSRDTG